jgi:hypothetical protein
MHQAVTTSTKDDADDRQKTVTTKNLPHLRQALRLAQKMAELLGGSGALFRTLPAQPESGQGSALKQTSCRFRIGMSNLITA